MALDWGRHRDTLQHLFLAEKKSLGEVMIIMQRNSFHATKSQYITQFRRWGWRKYLTDDEWHYIGQKLVSRQDTSLQRSVVYFLGSPVPATKISKELPRHISATSLSMGYTCSLPSPPCIQVKTPESLRPITDIESTISPISNLFDDAHKGINKLSPSPHYTRDMIGNYSKKRISTSECPLPKRDSFKIDLIQLPFCQFLDYMKKQDLQNTFKDYFGDEFIEFDYCTSKTSPEIPDVVNMNQEESSFDSVIWGYSTDADLLPLDAGPRAIIYDPFARLLVWNTYNPAIHDRLDLLRDISRCLSCLEHFVPLGFPPWFDHKMNLLLAPPQHSAALNFVEIITFLFSNQCLYPEDSPALEWIINTIPWEWLRAILKHNLPTIKALAVQIMEFLTSQDEKDLIKDLVHFIPGLEKYLGERCLHIALYRNNLDSLGVLLGLETQRELLTDSFFGLDILARARSVEAVELLTGAGADVNASFETVSCLFWVMDSGFEHVKVFVDAGANVNFSGNGNEATNLFYALRNQDYRVAQLLIQAGADITSPPKGDRNCGLTHLMVAVIQREIRTVQILLNHGAGTEVNKVYHPSTQDKYPDWKRTATALQIAATLGDLEIANLLIDAGSDVNEPAYDDDGVTALQAATEGGSSDMVQFLLSKGARINDSGRSLNHPPRPALLEAIEKNHFELVQLLLRAGADPNVHCSSVWGSSIFEVACAQNDAEELVALLRTGGAESTMEFSPLSLHAKHRMLQAVARGDLEMVQKLAVMGVKMEIIPVTFPSYEEYFSQYKDHYEDISRFWISNWLGSIDVMNPGREPITIFLLAIMAKSPGNKEVFEYLLYNYDNEDILNLDCLVSYPILLEAIVFRRYDIVEILLDAGADIEVTSNRNGYTVTALKIAANLGDVDMMHMLISRGAKIEKSDSYDDFTLLQAALNTEHGGSMEIVNLLLENGVSPQGSLSEPRKLLSPLQLAVLHIQENEAHSPPMKLVEFLLDMGADVNAGVGCHPRYGTALQIASNNAYGNIDLIRLLLDHGANVTIPTPIHGISLLGTPANCGYINIVKLLLEKGADVNESSSMSGNETPLEAAVQEGYLDMVKLLIDAGADSNLEPTQRFRRAEILAENFQYLVIAELLYDCRKDAVEEWNETRIQELDLQQASGGWSRNDQNDSLDKDTVPRMCKRPRISSEGVSQK